MTTNEIAFPFLPECKVSEPPEELMALLCERIARYTMGDSTSVPVETARRLLEGIVCCVELNRKRPAAAVVADAPLRVGWEAGVQEAKRLAKRAKLLLKEAERMQPPVTNRGFRDSLAAMREFFRAYDPDFFAQELPCSLDYPLCHPVSDALSGVEYLLDYLRRWLTESYFLRAFAPDALVSMYERYYGDYDDLLVNLYLPVSEMAALCALARKPVSALALSAEELADAGKLLRQKESASREALLLAAGSALEEIHIGGAAAQGYMHETALDFLVRFRAGTGEHSG